MMKKRCNLCNEVKPIDQFDHDKHIASGYRGRCKPCRRSVEAARKEAQKAGKDTKVAVIEAARQRHVSKEEREKQLYSQANQNAIRRLIMNREDEFRMLVEEERRKLGVTPKWVRLTG